MGFFDIILEEDALQVVHGLILRAMIGAKWVGAK
jgi:hypothetical protein